MLVQKQVNFKAFVEIFIFVSVDLIMFATFAVDSIFESCFSMFLGNSKEVFRCLDLSAYLGLEVVPLVVKQVLFSFFIFIEQIKIVFT